MSTGGTQAVSNREKVGRCRSSSNPGRDRENIDRLEMMRSPLKQLGRGLGEGESSCGMGSVCRWEDNGLKKSGAEYVRFGVTGSSLAVLNWEVHGGSF